MHDFVLTADYHQQNGYLLFLVILDSDQRGRGIDFIIKFFFTRLFSVNTFLNI